jgi:hypothetical protein
LPLQKDFILIYGIIQSAYLSPSLGEVVHTSQTERVKEINTSLLCKIVFISEIHFWFTSSISTTRNRQQNDCVGLDIFMSSHIIIGIYNSLIDAQHFM